MLDTRPPENLWEIRRSHKSARNRSLQAVLLFVTGLMVTIAAVDVWRAPPGDSQAVISLSMALLALWSYRMLKHKSSRLVSLPLLIGILVLGGWAMYSYGSVRASSSLAMIVAVVLAAAFLGMRYVMVTLLTGVAMLGVLTWAEAGGRLNKALFAADVRYWLLASGIMAVVGALLYYMQGATDEANVQRLGQMEDRLRLEGERDQSLRRFRRIFRLNPTALMIQLASTGVVLEVNPAFERSLGYEADRFKGQMAGSLWVVDSERREHLRVLDEYGATGWQQARWLRADGQATNVWVYSEMSEDLGGLLIITTVAEWFPGAAEASNSPDVEG